MKPQHMTRILDGKRYDTARATLLAHDAYWDGHNFERHGRNTFLWRTEKGTYFVTTQTLWQGERDSLEPVAREDAIRLFERDLPEHEVDHAEAFPDATVEEA